MTKKLGSLPFCLIALIGISTLMEACEFLDTKNNKRRREIESSIVGKYVIDFKRSKLARTTDISRQYEVNFFQSRVFRFDRHPPFLIDSIGEWRYVLEYDIAYLELNFNRAGDVQQALTDSTFIIIRKPQPKPGNDQVEELVLTKIE